MYYLLEVYIYISHKNTAAVVLRLFRCMVYTDNQTHKTAVQRYLIMQISGTALVLVESHDSVHEQQSCCHTLNTPAVVMLSSLFFFFCCKRKVCFYLYIICSDADDSMNGERLCHVS